MAGCLSEKGTRFTGDGEANGRASRSVVPDDIRQLGPRGAKRDGMIVRPCAPRCLAHVVIRVQRGHERGFDVPALRRAENERGHCDQKEKRSSGEDAHRAPR
jgi:hypothetical protein